LRHIENSIAHIAKISAKIGFTVKRQLIVPFYLCFSCFLEKKSEFGTIVREKGA
jgi:hypothetical protein